MTVVARRIIASPVRTASEVWQVIAGLIAPSEDSEVRAELRAISGVVCSLIAAEAMRSAPIVVWGVGPRVRIYCLYDVDAMVGEQANENPLPEDVTAGDWSMSLPCPADDLEWVRTALAKRSTRITARDIATEFEVETGDDTRKSATIDEEAFFRS